MRGVRAVKWSFWTQISQFLIYFIVNVTLSRILSPADFGTFAIVSIFIGFISTIKDFGVGSFLVNRQDLTPGIKNTVFLINLASVLVLCTILVISSFFIADLYNDPRLRIFIPLCCIGLLIDGFAVVPDSMLHKEMNFHHLFVTRLVSQVIGGATAVLLALNGWGVYSLVFQSITISLCSYLALLYFYPFIPGTKFDRTVLKNLFSFSGPIFVDSIVQFWTRNIDNLLVGKIFGASSLGIYNRAYTLMQLPTQNLSSVISRVLFPYLSRNQNDPEAAASIYLRSIQNIIFISFPGMALMHLCAGDIIQFLYGAKWMSVVPLLKIFALVGAIESMLYPTGSLFMAFGRTSRMFRINTFVRSVIIVFIVIGSFYSVQAIVIFYLTATLITGPFVLKACCELLKIEGRTLFATIIPVFGKTLLAGALTFLFMQYVLDASDGALLRMVSSTLVFAFVYLSLNISYARNTLKMMFR